MSDVWVANLNSGITLVERWAFGGESPWVRLVKMCEENSAWVTNLRLTICSEVISLPSHAEGYCQIYQHIILKNVPLECTPVVRGIGHVSDGVIKVLWGVRTPRNVAYFYHDELPVEGQENIIWKPK